jgi:CRISPR/Cas system-associated exonuclease Cas4 (RecB family)
MTYSQSQFRQFKFCQKKYYYRYVENLPDKTSRPAGVGINMHHLGEVFYEYLKKTNHLIKHKRGDFKKILKLLSPEDVPQEYWVYLNNFAEFEEVRYKVIDDLGNFLPIHVELDILNKDLNFRGRLDFVFRDGKELTMIDFKKKRADEKFRADDRLQLYMYSVLFKNKFNKEIDNVGNYYYGHEWNDACDVEKMDDGKLLSGIYEIESMIEKIEKAKKTKKLNRRPSSRKCFMCGYLDLCADKRFKKQLEGV